MFTYMRLGGNGSPFHGIAHLDRNHLSCTVQPSSNISQGPLNHMESETTRKLSLSLFHEVKPLCQELSELSQANLSESNDSLVYSLRQLLIALGAHHRKHQTHDYGLNNDAYIISTRLADYIFFPLSNLLKRLQLAEPVVQYILEILAFLVSNSWCHDLDEGLLDQLFTLVLFLCGGGSIQKLRESCLEGKNPGSVSAIVACLVALLRCTPRDYYTRQDNLAKHLSVLGDSTTILLDALRKLGKGSEDEARTILHTLSWLYSTRVTGEQASFVFPGIISKVINFHSESKTLSTETLLAILQLLQTIIVKVFSDKDLSISLSDESSSLSDLLSLSLLLENGETAPYLKEVPIRVEIPNPKSAHRSESWLLATSKQLKISILIFMKNFILNPSSKVKIRSNKKLVKGIVEFVSQVVKNCFRALFREIIPSTLDILSALFFVESAHEQESVQDAMFLEIQAVYLTLGRTDLELLFKQLCLKTTDLYSSQLPRVLLSSSEEKIGLCLFALKVHMYVISKLFELLLKSPGILEELSSAILETLASNIALNMSRDIKQKAQGSKKDLLDILSRGSLTQKEMSNNQMDEIELPPHIDVRNIGTIKNKEQSLMPVARTNMAKTIDLNFQSQQDAPRLLGRTYTGASEQMIQELTRFLGMYCRGNTESIISSLILKPDSVKDHDSLAQQSVRLWLANSLITSSSPLASTGNDFKIDEYMQFEDDSNELQLISTESEETNYLLLLTAQDMLDSTKQLLDDSSFDPKSREYKMCESAYTVALQTMGQLSSRIDKADFQADVLMDYLYPLLEALTFTPDSQVYLQARVSLGQIVHVHYNGLIESLVRDNADYLIDSLSMNLSVASGLKPSLPGILLIVIRISGIELLLLNQLQDILSEIFIVIDSFHGYSTLMENFFHVFEEIVCKVMQLYGKELSDCLKVMSDSNCSLYRPWGLTDRRHMLHLIDDANKIVDPFADYDPEKEYFHRKPGVPFAEQEGDSDDEDNDGIDEHSGEEPSDKPEQWPSLVPQNIYLSVQQIFTYGLQLLSHPSVKLRMQILRTLKKAYPIMASNYKTLMPIVAQYWPHLLVLSTGVSTLSDNVDGFGVQQHESLQQLIAPTLDFITVVFEEDAKHEKFMSSRFVDMWEFMKQRDTVVSKIINSDDGSGTGRVISKITHPAPSLKLSQLLIRGINIYERSVPDLLAHDIVSVCRILGIDKSEELGREVQNHLWVLSN